MSNISGQWVEIEFECLPLRSITRTDIPVDASPKYEQFILRVKKAMQRHGTHNTYYLHRGRCGFHLTNDPDRGMIQFAFEGTAMTDTSDIKTRSLDLQMTLQAETCGWLNERIVDFFIESTKQAIAVEFDRYIAAGDLDQTRARLEALDQQDQASAGYIAMYL